MIKKLGAAFFALLAAFVAFIAISGDQPELLPFSAIILAVPVVTYFMVKFFPGFFESKENADVGMLVIGAALTGAVPGNTRELLNKDTRTGQEKRKSSRAGLPPSLETVHEALIRSALDMLKGREQFKPFGIVLEASGEVALFTPGGANLWEVLLNLKEGFRQGAAAGEITAGGICVQNLFENPATGKTDCSLSCFLETTGGTAVRSSIPYGRNHTGQLEVEYADTASGQLPIIFGNVPGEHPYSDQHVWYSLAHELVKPYLLYQDRSGPGPGTPRAADDIGRGIDLLHRAIEVCPREPGPLFLLAKAYQVLGNSEGEHAALARLSEALPDDPEVARELAHALLMLGRTEDALVAANRAAELKPDDPGILANLALAYLIAGRLSEAIKAITQSLKISPADPVSRNLLAAIRAIVAKKWPQPRSLRELNAFFSGNAV